jgi:flagellar basal-body rod modification protein FlgD
MSPIPSTNSTTIAATAANATGAVTSSSVEVDKNMFLQLLVAQLQNQDPMNPTDSSTFVTQLAQFQQLESTVNMGQDVSQIRSDADQFLADYTAGTATGAAGTDTNQTTQP